jgi:sugar lactone lactonase YvrE
VISTVAGTGNPGFSGDGGAATAAQLQYPWGMAVDSAGNLYIADAGNHRIRKVTAVGIISTVAGAGVKGYSGDGGTATAALLDTPFGVAMDSAGNLYIADTNNRRIRKVTPAGVISTVAGTGVFGYSGDGGAPTAAQLSNLEGVVVDSTGNLYIADDSNHCIRKVNPAAVISTVAGTGSYGYSGDGGAATAAQLFSPRGVAVDSAGNMYIADTYNHRIRKVTGAPSVGAPVNGLSGYWKLNNDATDSSGTSNHGVILYRSSPSSAFKTGKLGSALDSSGGAYVEVSDSPSLSALGSLTVEAWINLNSYPVHHVHPEYDAAPIIIKWGYARDEEYTLAVSWEGKLDATFAGSGVIGRPVDIIGSDQEVPLRAWTHVAATIEAGRTMALYINGALVKTKATTLIPNWDMASPVHIGYMWVDDGGPKSFDGLIDEVRIWGRALSQAEITSNMDRELSTAACVYTIFPPSRQHGAGSEAGSIGVTCPAQCSWSVMSSVLWIAVTSAPTGTGSGTVSYSVSPNPGTSSRTGTLTIAGQTYTISQAAPLSGCTYSLSTTSASLGAYDGGAEVAVTASRSDCAWSATSNASWMAITSGSPGTGSGRVSYSAAANPAPGVRTGTLTIAGQTYTVSQEAPPPPCTYSITPPNAAVGAEGGAGTVTVTASRSECSWTATGGAQRIDIQSWGNRHFWNSPPSWISASSVVFGVSGNTVNGTLGYRLFDQFNPSAIVQLFVAVERKVVCTLYNAIPGAEGVSGTKNCSFVYDSATYGTRATVYLAGTWAMSEAIGIYHYEQQAGGWRCPIGSVSVVSGTPSESWIRITYGSSGTGSGTLSYSVSANTSTSSRTGTLTIAGQTFTVTQPPLPTFQYDWMEMGNQANRGTVTPGAVIPLPDWTPGKYSAVQFFITNRSGTTQRVGSIAVTGSAFRLTGVPSLPVTLTAAQPGVQIGFVIEFSPSTTGEASGTLTIDGSAFQLRASAQFPAVAGVTMSGVSSTATPTQRLTLGIGLARAYGVALTGTVTLGFTPDAVNAGDDQAVGFTGGGRTVNFTVAADGTQAGFASGTANQFSTGTTAGTITVTVSLRAGSVDVTPSPAPSVSIRIARSVPAISNVAIVNRTTSGFEVHVTGFSTPRDVTQATFRFTGSNLQTTDLTVDVNTAFTNWYRGAESSQYGSTFKYIQPFSVPQGSVSNISSVTVTLRNSQGNSTSASVNF